MKSDKRILLAFILNLTFSAFELIGGILTGSVAIISDCVHDLGDSISIGLSYSLEKRSKKGPDATHPFGYLRYSVLGSLITAGILAIGSVLVFANALDRLMRPIPIHYDRMILFALLGAAVNLAAAFFTHGGDSLNQRAVSLHMLEDVLGWLVVLVGAVIMKFTDITYIDPILSMGVAVFILVHAFGSLRAVLDIFLEKTPKSVDIDHISEHLSEIPGVLGVHCLQIRSLDGFNHTAAVHIVTDGDTAAVKRAVKEELRSHGIGYSVVETEAPDEACDQICSHMAAPRHTHRHHHHHHH